MVEKILKRLFILQEVSNDNREPKLGRGFSTARRVNPYNPLSYIALILFTLACIIKFGFVGIFEEMKNPFKCD